MNCGELALAADDETDYIHGESMTKEAIKERVHAAPFIPFSVRLTDGRTCEVPGADYVSLSPTGRTIILYTDGGDGVRILDVALITEIITKSVD